MKLTDLAHLIHKLPTAQTTLLLGKPGIGKCLGYGTPVLKADGSIVPVQDIAPNDRLMGPDGLARVVQTTAKGRGPLYQIDPIKGESWVCNDAHGKSVV